MAHPTYLMRYRWRKLPHVVFLFVEKIASLLLNWTLMKYRWLLQMCFKSHSDAHSVTSFAIATSILFQNLKSSTFSSDGDFLTFSGLEHHLLRAAFQNNSPLRSMPRTVCMFRSTKLSGSEAIFGRSSYSEMKGQWRNLFIVFWAHNVDFKGA